MSDFAAIHARLRAVMLAAAPPDAIVDKDDPGDLAVRTAARDPRTGQRGWFGTVTVRRSYVAFHLMPLYLDPGLAAEISPALAARRQGKTCFNFRMADDALFAELAALTARAAAHAP